MDKEKGKENAKKETSYTDKLGKRRNGQTTGHTRKKAKDTYRKQSTNISTKTTLRG